MDGELFRGQHEQEAMTSPATEGTARAKSAAGAQ